MRKACWNCKNYEMKLNEHNYGYEWCNFHNKLCDEVLVRPDYMEEIIYCDNWQNDSNELTDEEKIELLDILKKHSRITRITQDYVECIEIYIGEYDEDFAKIKRWLRDDK